MSVANVLAGGPHDVLSTALHKALFFHLPVVSALFPSVAAAVGVQPMMRRPVSGDVEISLFPQEWETCSLGFPGFSPVHADAVRAYTTVVMARNGYRAVYFHGMAAYLVPPDSDLSEEQCAAWKADLGGFGLVDCASAVTRYGATLLQEKGHG